MNIIQLLYGEDGYARREELQETLSLALDTGVIPSEFLERLIRFVVRNLIASDEGEAVYIEKHGFQVGDDFIDEFLHPLIRLQRFTEAEHEKERERLTRLIGHLLALIIMCAESNRPLTRSQRRRLNAKRQRSIGRWLTEVMKVEPL